MGEGCESKTQQSLAVHSLHLSKSDDEKTYSGETNKIELIAYLVNAGERRGGLKVPITGTHHCPPRREGYKEKTSRGENEPQLTISIALFDKANIPKSTTCPDAFSGFKAQW